MQTRIFTMVLLSLALIGCAPDALRAPDLNDNKLYFSCMDQLVTTHSAFQSNKEGIPPAVKQRVISLLIAAEIDGQFKHYPSCVNKLERAHFFLTQVKPDIFVSTRIEPGQPGHSY